MTIRRGELAVTGLIVLLFGAGPTVGDIGSCGRAATELDQRSFARARKTEDCQRCSRCGLMTETCRRECDPNAPSLVAWPPTCRPLEHDGEVCLRALDTASCGDYASFVDDVSPTLPTECDFCRVFPDAGEGEP